MDHCEDFSQNAAASNTRVLSRRRGFGVSNRIRRCATYPSRDPSELAYAVFVTGDRRAPTAESHGKHGPIPMRHLDIDDNLQYWSIDASRKLPCRSTASHTARVQMWTLRALFCSLCASSNSNETRSMASAHHSDETFR